MKSSTSGRESMVKFCQDRVHHVEKNYGLFCQSLGSITRKIAKMRDKGDMLSKQIRDFAEKDKVSVSSSKNLKEFASNLSAIQDYRDAEIHRLENNVIKPLSHFGPKCKHMKQVIKKEQGAINTEIKQRKKLMSIREKHPGDAQQIGAAETEFEKAANDANIGIKGLNKQMVQFETEKIRDIKKILADFVSIEMVFHAKAIEFYSQCFENIALVDEEMDLESFQRKMNNSQGASLDLPTGTMGGTLGGTLGGTQDTLGSTGLTLGSTAGSSSEYTSTGASYTYTYGESTQSSGGEKRVRIQTQSMYADVDDDDEYDDDDDDDEDEEEDVDTMYAKPVRRQ